MKELEDYTCYPSVLRNFQTEFIGFVVVRFHVYDSFIRFLETLSLPLKSMTDLCSGSGEPAIRIFRKSSRFQDLTLSDKYPNTRVLKNDKIFYSQQSADVLTMKFNPETCYTMFNAFHHFKDEEKLKIAQNITSTGSTALFVEILEPNIICLMKVVLSTILGSLLLTPFIRPFSLTRILLTYIIPVNVFTITFDGIVSVFKSRSLTHYQKLFLNYSNTIEVLKLNNRLSPLIVIKFQQKK